MRRIAFLTLVASAILALSGCTKESFSYIPDSHWITEVNGSSEGHRLALTFYGSKLKVLDASSSDRPFSSGEWDYSIVDGNYLRISREEYEGDGEYYTYTYEFDLEVDEQYTTMRLYYYPTFGSRRSWTFTRR